jgi:repressor LexA
MTDSVAQARPAKPGGTPRPKGRPGRKPKGSVPVIVPQTPDKPDPDHVLTWRQRKILRAIRESVQQRGYPPSLREIGDTVGLTSTASVGYQLGTLQRKGYLHRGVGQARTMELRLPGGPPVRPQGAAGPSARAEAELAHVPGVDIPAQAGEGTLFLLEVAGGAMISATIADGDWVVVRQQADARNGDAVAAALGNEASVLGRVVAVLRRG